MANRLCAPFCVCAPAPHLQVLRPLRIPRTPTLLK